MVGEEDRSKDARGKSTEETLDRFVEFGSQPKPEQKLTAIFLAKPKPKAKRRSKADRDRDRRIKVVEKEHKLDGKSKTINLKRCFVSNLRVSQEAWEEIRARTIERLAAWAAEAEIRAVKKGKKTIQLEDII
jgi:histone H3/H4